MKEEHEHDEGPSTLLSATTLTDCSTFLIVGAVLGSLLVVASVMMCVLSHRLYKVRLCPWGLCDCS